MLTPEDLTASLKFVSIESTGIKVPVVTLPPNSTDEDKAFAMRFVTSVANGEQLSPPPVK